MIFVPATYFSLLGLYSYRKQGFSIATFMVLMYAFTAIINIPLYYFPDCIYTDDLYRIPLHWLPTLVYCLVPTLVIYPFYRFDSSKKRELTCPNERLFTILAYIFIGTLLFMLIFYASDILFRLRSGADIGDLRGDALLLSQSAQATSTGVVRLLSNICNSISSMSTIAMVLFYYSICFLKRSKAFNILLLISSLSGIIIGIHSIDRSITFYWLLKFILIYLFFLPYINAKIKKKIFAFLLIFFSLGLVYIVMVTVSRFGENTDQSLLYYFGQNYLYFCWLWDRYIPVTHNYGMLCPILSHFFIDWGCPVDAVPFGVYVQDITGDFVNVFYTFMGTITLYLGKEWILPLSILFFVLASYFVNTKDRLSIFDLIICCLWAFIPLCSIFVYMISEYVYALGFMFIFLYCLLAKHISRHETHSAV